MMMDRENRVKLIKNIGQYLIDHAEQILPDEEVGRASRQILTVDLSTEAETPLIAVETEYKAIQVLNGVRWVSATFGQGA